MPNVTEKWDWQLIALLLSVYDDGTWAENLAHWDRPEATMDGAVEVLATRKSDGLTLAIEHTLIEPFEGDKTDFHGLFKSLQRRLREDDSLRWPGFALYLDLPVGALPRKCDWKGIADDITAWLVAERPTFTSNPSSPRRCHCPHHPSSELTLWVRLSYLGDPARSFPVVVWRHGAMDLGGTVEKALKKKLGKLVKTPAARRLLLLERDQGSVFPADILTAVHQRRDAFPDLASVDEIWIADTASFEEKHQWASFSHSVAAVAVSEQFDFYDRKLLARYRNGMPVPLIQQDTD